MTKNLQIPDTFLKLYLDNFNSLGKKNIESDKFDGKNN